MRPASPDDPLLPSLIFGFGSTQMEFDGRSVEFFYLILGLLVAVYLGLRWLVNSRFGYIIVAVREDSHRTETYGYDIRLIQLTVFCIAAALAGLAGVLYTSWGNLHSSKPIWLEGEHSTRNLGCSRGAQGPYGRADWRACP